MAWPVRELRVTRRLSRRSGDSREGEPNAMDLITAWRFLLKRPTSTVIAMLTLGITVAIGTIAVGAIDQAFWRPAAGAAAVSSSPSTTAVPPLLSTRRSRIPTTSTSAIGCAIGSSSRRSSASRTRSVAASGRRARGESSYRLTTFQCLGPAHLPAVCSARTTIAWPVRSRSSCSATISGSDGSMAIAAVIGGLVRLGGRDFSVVGIAPRGFQGSRVALGLLDSPGDDPSGDGRRCPAATGRADPADRRPADDGRGDSHRSKVTVRASRRLHRVPAGSSRCFPPRISDSGRPTARPSASFSASSQVSLRAFSSSRAPISPAS